MKISMKKISSKIRSKRAMILFIGSLFFFPLSLLPCCADFSMKVTEKINHDESSTKIQLTKISLINADNSDIDSGEKTPPIDIEKNSSAIEKNSDNQINHINKLHIDLNDDLNDNETLKDLDKDEYNDKVITSCNILNQDHALGFRQKSYDDFSPSSKRKDPEKIVRILSLDGGGVKGVMQAYMLKEIEKKVGKNIFEIFDLIGGTSIGGIMAMALTIPKEDDKSKPKFSAKELYKIIYNESRKIFSKKTFGCFGLLHWFWTKYDSKPLENFITTHLGKDQLFFDLLTPTVITTFDTQTSCTKLIKSWDKNEIFYAKDVALSTSAAPTYFNSRRVYPIDYSEVMALKNEPKKNITKGKTIMQIFGLSANSELKNKLADDKNLNNVSKSNDSCLHNSYTLVDGGICCNNPTLKLMESAKNIFPDSSRFEILSIGTGDSSKPLNFIDIKGAGKLKWGTAFVDLAIAGQSSDVHHTLLNVLEPGTNYYTRWSPSIDTSNSRLDNDSPKNISELVVSIKKHIDLRLGEFNELIDCLKKEKPKLYIKKIAFV